MTLISDRINQLEESQTIKMAKMGRELADKGFSIINLSFGEPDFQTPDHIKEAAKKAIDEGYTHYSPVAGYPELKKAIVNKLKRENNLEYTIDQIVVSTGAKQSLANILMCLLNPGDEVIIPTPYWVSYSELVKLGEGKSVFIQTDEASHFKINAGQLEAAITPKTKLFLFSSPNNPTGSVYSKAELHALVEVFERNPQIYIISDEIYEHINYLGRHESIAEFPSVKERVILVNGVSKAFAMTGWRLGYMASPKEIAQACEKVQSQITSGTSSITQRASLAALQENIDPTIEMRKAFLRRRDMMYGRLKAIPGISVDLPDGAFYFFPRVNYFFGKKFGEEVIQNAGDLALYLLNHAHVSTVQGDAFGSKNHIRISYAASDQELKTALDRIEEALGKLK
jgi:aspartate aminotransferase